MGSYAQTFAMVLMPSNVPLIVARGQASSSEANVTNTYIDCQGWSAEIEKAFDDKGAPESTCTSEPPGGRCAATARQPHAVLISPACARAPAPNCRCRLAGARVLRLGGAHFAAVVDHRLPR